MLLLSYCVIQQLCILAFFFNMNEVKTNSPQEPAREWLPGRLPETGERLMKTIHQAVDWSSLRPHPRLLEPRLSNLTHL